MILANKISDLYNIKEYLPKNLTLNIEDYNKIHDSRDVKLRCAPVCLRYIYFLPNESIPQHLLSAALSLKYLIKSDEFLSLTISDKDVVKEWKKLTNNPIPTLFELIVDYKKIPIKIITNIYSNNIMNDVDNCYKLQILCRFLTNIGNVFYSELLNNTVTYLGAGNHTGLPIEIVREYYNDLIQDGILRQATEEDLHIILKYKTKEELFKAIAKIEIENTDLIKYKNKTEIIQKLTERVETKSINLQQYFCFLNHDVQELKEWIVKEARYFSLWRFFNDFKIAESYYCFEGIMKDIVSINNDYDTAIKLGNLFFQLTEYYREIGKNRIERESIKVKKLIEMYQKKANKKI